MSDIKGVTEKLFKARDAHDVDACLALVSEDFKYTEYAQGLIGLSKSDWGAFLTKMFAATTDDKLTIRAIKGTPELFNVEVSGSIVTELAGQPFKGTIEGVSICSLNSEGKFTECTSYIVFTPAK